MANMSYCAFQNTLSDLKQCVGLLEDELDDGYMISDEEFAAAQHMAEEIEKYKSLLATVIATRTTT